MKTLVVLNALFSDEHSYRPFHRGLSAFELASTFAESLPGFQAMATVVGLEQTGNPECMEAMRRFRDGGGELLSPEEACWTPSSLFTRILEKARRAECDTVAFAFADAPFMAKGLAAEVARLFERYRVDYASADGYPAGCAPEFCAVDALPAVARLAEGLSDVEERDLLFKAISKDINFFDIETAVSRIDVREFRLSFFMRGTRERALCEKALKDRLFSEDPAATEFDADRACEAIPRNLGLLRTVPAFYSVQVVSGCDQDCSYCPYPATGRIKGSPGRTMSTDDFGRLVDSIRSLSGDPVIDISLWGEPALHPEAEELVRIVRSRGLRLIVETSGISWKPGALERLAAEAGDGTYWVVSLDARDPSRYARIRGEGYERATRFAEDAIRLFPSTAYVQALRLAEGEDDLEAFYKYWKGRTERVIVQKYDWFCGRLPGLKVADLSPLVRRPCWHLARDMSILVDGSVPMCRETSLVADAGKAASNALAKGGLAAAWKELEADFGKHLEGRHEGPCGNCDEYYTYNF